MGGSAETLEQSAMHDPGAGARPPAEPGLVLVFAGGRPAAAVVRAERGAVILGRDLPAFGEQGDPRMSRRHAAARWNGRRFEVTDLGSRNGTAVDGVPLGPRAAVEANRAIRAGDSIFVPVEDVAPFERLGVRVAGGRVEGPALQETLLAAAGAARVGPTLHIKGESGSGKEGVARAFHAAGPGSGGPFEAVNCAAIPEGVAERLLFGAKRGAYSGAADDAEGYVEAARGGVLFLDEVAELSLAVQAKLLRVLETGEVLALGAARPKKVDLRFCSATHRDLRALAAAGRLREDLFFRVATPRVVVPPLRERPEEVAYLALAEVQRADPSLAIHPSLVEACLLRVWPGNVRELCAEVRSAAQTALAQRSPRVEAAHLAELAGSALAGEAAPPVEPAESATPPEGEPPLPSSRPSKARIAAELKRFEGNVAAAARELGLHRTQLRRWMDRYGLDARAFGPRE